MDFAPEGPMAIPLWINGHAYLTVAEQFFTVHDVTTGDALRQVPLCGEAEAAEALRAAREALAGWRGLDSSERQACLDALADGLNRYAGHFAKLLRQEIAIDEVSAEAEVLAAVELLREGGYVEMAPSVCGIVLDPLTPLSSFVAVAAPLWRAGATLVVKPSPKAPAAVFALCELTARTAWPAGVCNLLQGDLAAVQGLCAVGLDRLIYRGQPELGRQIQTLAASQGVVCQLQAA